MKKVIFSAALLMAAATFSFAGNPKETKDAKPEVATATPNEGASSAEIKWFRFDGEPGDEGVASEYTVVASPSCTSTTATYRCEIRIEAQTANPSLPNLSSSVLEERKKTNP